MMKIQMQVSEDDVLDLIDRVLARTNIAEVTKEYILTGLVKLYGKFGHNGRERIRASIEKFTTSSVLEVQQRACEYLHLIDNEWDIHREGVFEPIPVSPLVNVADKAIGDVEIDEVPPQARTAGTTPCTLR
eukprot:TRINITY_DN4245_c0_g1_i1.p1 TRINITY_DN4245_c0_g1~~TRINITY_DN4245_c0_g1_i1.p1  ORF type:complete len:131 (+),score=26.58 TRINITY_DN4245_c0_g1_i1:74-466(+)